MAHHGTKGRIFCISAADNYENEIWFNGENAQLHLM
jgi:hypothetical protein